MPNWGLIVLFPLLVVFLGACSSDSLSIQTATEAQGSLEQNPDSEPTKSMQTATPTAIIEPTSVPPTAIATDTGTAVPPTTTLAPTSTIVPTANSEPEVFSQVEVLPESEIDWLDPNWVNLSVGCAHESAHFRVPTTGGTRAMVR